MATSYNGWPANPKPSRIGINPLWEPIKGHRFPGGIKSGDVQTVFTYLIQQLDARVEPIEEYPPGDEWGYSYRVNVNNPNVLSCHASGTAVDYNATQHPNKVKYTWTREQTREIHQIIDDELNGIIKWLEGFDEMHFEVRGTEKQVAAIAKLIRAGQVGPKPPPPDPDDEDDDMALPPPRIIWYTDPRDSTKAHAYQVWTHSGIGKHLNAGALRVCRSVGIEELPADKPLDVSWQETLALLDGPCKSV